MTGAMGYRTEPAGRLDRSALYPCWRRSVVGRVDRQAVLARLFVEGGWSPCFAFMTLISAGFAVLVLVSPLQAPTAESVAQTRPNPFNLGVALFAALAVPGLPAGAPSADRNYGTRHTRAIATVSRSQDASATHA